MERPAQEMTAWPPAGRRGALLGRTLLLAVGLAGLGRSAEGTTANGNELALYYTEAKTDTDRRVLKEAAMGKQHFFRYLQVNSLQEGEIDGYPYVYLSMREPSSQMTVSCKVMKSLSLAKLKEDPPTKVGDCVALTGVVSDMDPDQKLIKLNPVIVRFKDRLAPKAGKELLAEVDASAVIYSYTGGKTPVNVTRRDQDLLQREGEITAAQGKDGWVRFLQQEMAKRDKAALAARNKLNIFRRATAPVATNDAAPPPPITEDEE